MHIKFKKIDLWIALQLFIYEIFAGFYVRIVGNISLGDIMLLLIFPYLLYKNNLLIKDKNFRKISYLYLLFLVTQFISEIANGNQIVNAFKGISITIVSFVTLYFFYSIIQKNIKYLLFLLFFETCRLLIFINATDISQTIFEVDFSNSTYYKFRVSPILSNIGLILSFYLLKFTNKIIASGVLLFVILINVFFGARSANIPIFFSIILLLMSGWLINNKKSAIFGLIFITIISYCCYCLWVSSATSKSIKTVSSNNDQFLRMNNPYNPFELLLQGRTEFFIGLVAFSDRWKWGFGSWAIDKDYKYYYMGVLTKFGEVRDDFDTYLEDEVVPSHSVIVGAGVNYGILGIIIMFVIFSFFVKMGYTSYRTLIGSPYFIIFIFFYFQMIWTMLFSPPGHLRQTLPLIFSFLLVFKKVALQKEIQTIK